MKYIYILLIFFVSLINSNQVNADDNLILSLKEGGKIIFIRHALAPGNGDPENFNIYDCSTQRNLDEKGIQQAKKIGNFFKSNNISIENVYSSEWCRCKDTANYAFSKFKTFDALNSFYDEKFQINKDKQITDLKIYIKNWNGNKNLVFITHYVVISELFNQGAASGEIIISNKNYQILGSILIR
tara:strand:- start:1049 stop:1603 length:555 start_codon:yes stop_codon:yes gene_type:complete